MQTDIHAVVQAAPRLELTNDQMLCRGYWTAHYLGSVQKDLMDFSLPSITQVTINASELQALDSVGAWLIIDIKNRLQSQGKNVSFVEFNPEHASLLTLIEAQAAKINEKEIEKTAARNFNLFYLLGKSTVGKALEARHLVTFIGQVFIELLQAIAHPVRIQVKALLSVVESMGYKALPIVGLLNFLIGLVLAYQMGQQLKVYGANVYIVGISGVAVLQEFAPLITAIIVAGRTSSAFTAQIGSMKINEEIDALLVMGLSPINRLVLPKIFGLIIALPLLTIWADFFGILGSMMMAKHGLDLSYYDYLLRFPKVIELHTLVNGLVKTPIFAIIIATVGCFQGFNVALSADSVGKQTTKSVVQAIFLIIISDAIFSIVQSWQSF